MITKSKRIILNLPPFLFAFLFLSYGQTTTPHRSASEASDTLKGRKIEDSLKLQRAAGVDTLKAKSPYEIGEEVIKGERPYLIEEKKLFVLSPFNPFLLIEERLKPSGYIYDERLYYSVDSLTIPSLFVASNYLRVPVKRRFIYGDVLILFPSFERTVASWRLVILSPYGEEIKRAEGEGMPPATIVWDGRKDDGEMISPGEVYSFTFYAYDAIGNETKITGEPLKISGIFYEEKGKKIISISAREIFKEMGQELTPQAKEILDEAANLVKENFKKELTVFIYSHREDMLPVWVEIIEGELKKRILLPKGTISVAPRFMEGLAPRYSKIDIIIN